MEVDEMMAERRQLTLREIAMLLTLLLNFGGLVWGAATMSNSVTDLDSTVEKLNTTVQTIVIDITQIKVDYNARLKVLEDRDTRRGE